MIIYTLAHMGEKRDMFAGLRWAKEIRSLGDLIFPLIRRRNLSLGLEIELVMTAI